MMSNLGIHGSYFIPRPCALSDADGIPTKGISTDFFETRYKKFEVIVSVFPGAWIPQSVILEGTFMIQTAPPLGITTFQQYTDMLLSVCSDTPTSRSTRSACTF